VLPPFGLSRNRLQLQLYVLARICNAKLFPLNLEIG